MRNRRSDKRIVLTGGGSTGHVSVNLALIPRLLKDGWEIYYMGSKDGIERELIEKIDGVRYIPIATGKLRRYFSFENLKDVFKVFWGCLQSIFKVRKIRPNVIFSKGGFVSVPVLFGGFVNRIPSITHESDLTPGLANKLVQPFVKKVFTTFPETEKYIKSGKGEYIGPVIRDGLFEGKPESARKFLKIDNDKPVILAMGGSLGAGIINRVIRENIDSLLQNYNVIHSCGQDSLDKSIDKEGYFQFEYISENLNHIISFADIVVTRAGSNAIFEFLFYRKPMLLIPLGLDQSRGDQIDNARSFEREGFGRVLMEEDLSNEMFLKMVNDIYSDREKYEETMKNVDFEDNIGKIYSEIKKIKL